MAEAEQRTQAEQKTFGTPDETRSFEKGKLDLLNIGGGVVGRLTLEPGWRWSEHVKPIAQTASCQVAHTGYIVSGRLHVRMDDGTEVEMGPGEASITPPGHDAWVVGDEPVVFLDFAGAATYAKPR